MVGNGILGKGVRKMEIPLSCRVRVLPVTERQFLTQERGKTFVHFSLNSELL